MTEKVAILIKNPQKRFKPAISMTNKIISMTKETIPTTVEMFSTIAEMFSTTVEMFSTVKEIISTTVEMFYTTVEMFSTVMEMSAMVKETPSMVMEMRPGNPKIVPISLIFEAVERGKMAGMIFSKPIRADIFVASPSTNGQSSVRSDIIGRADGICRPAGADVPRPSDGRGWPQTG